MNNHALPAASSFRPPHLRLLMAGLGAAWKRGVLPPPDLRAATLRQQAQAATGLGADTIDRAFFERQLAVLLDDLHQHARLNVFGKLVAHGSLLKVMQERLWFEDLLTRHPEIDRIRLAPPIVIAGSMRSGTTRLQRLLACNPAFNALKLYEAQSPVPTPAVIRARRAGRADPRIWRTAAAIRFIGSINPATLHAHPTGALEVDEELGLNLQSLSGAMIEAQWRVPAFARHCETVSQLPAYARLARLLKARCWLEGSDPARPFVLKTPQHLQDLAALMQVFPQARLLFLHRDPATMVASGASLVWNQMVIQSDAVDPHWVGGEWLHKTAHRLSVAARLRPLIDPRQQMDLHFDEVDADWQAAMQRIHAFLGVELTPPALAAMQAYLQRAERRHGFRRHRYRLAHFGLGEGDVRARLGA